MGPLEKITTTINVLKEIASADVKLEAAELKMKLANAMTQLADLKIEVLGIQEERDSLKRRVDGSDEISSLRKAFTIHPKESFYILASQVADWKPGNYCAACFDKDGKAILLMPFGSSGHKCNVCSTKYHHGATVPAAPVVIRNRRNTQGWFD